jgi:hypothetical protein
MNPTSRFTSRRRLWLRLATAVAVLVFLLATLCDAGQDIPASRSSSPQPTDAQSEVATPSSLPPTDAEPQYPNLSEFTDPLDQYVYKAAYSDCHFLGVDGIADAYGGDREDSASVARSYASFMYGAQQQEAGFQGCLDAFGAEA